MSGVPGAGSVALQPVELRDIHAALVQGREQVGRGLVVGGVEGGAAGLRGLGQQTDGALGARRPLAVKELDDPGEGVDAPEVEVDEDLVLPCRSWYRGCRVERRQRS